jgi:queuosine precursor transporter
VNLPETPELTRKRNHLFLILSGIVLTNAVVAEIIGVKIFSAEQTVGLPPARISLLGDFVLDFNLSAGVVIWPVVFITSDIINEYFGKAGVRKISILTAIFIAYSFLVIYLVTLLPPAQFWLDVNAGSSGGNFNINNAFGSIFRQGLGIISGSITAFFVGQLLDAYVFQWIRSLTGSRFLWLRATGSTLVSQLIDSFVVLFVAFYLFGNPRWSMPQVLSVSVINYFYKGGVAILITPLLYLVHNLIDNYLGKAAAQKISEEATTL